MINLSQFLTIGTTSALTVRSAAVLFSWMNVQADVFDRAIQCHNVIGAFKTIGILSIGWTVASKTPTFTDVGGMLLVLGGAGLYAHAASKPAKVQLPRGLFQNI